MSMSASIHKADRFKAYYVGPNKHISVSGPDKGYWVVQIESKGGTVSLIDLSDEAMISLREVLANVKPDGESVQANAVQA